MHRGEAIAWRVHSFPPGHPGRSGERGAPRPIRLPGAAGNVLAAA